MPGAHGVESERDSLLKQRRKLDALVAPHTGVRCASGLVFGDEVVDHVLLESLGEVPDVIRNAENVCRSLGIHRVFDGAASS